MLSYFINSTVCGIAITGHVFITFLLLAVQLRFLISFFLNINPYYEPFLSLWAFTNPVINFGRNLYPRIAGLEIAPMVNLVLLNNLDSICKHLFQITGAVILEAS
jgi:uncharacterized protein YggT (Ycf19 family)